MGKLCCGLEENLAALGRRFHAPENGDFVVRECAPGGVRMAVVYVDGMAERKNIEDMILRPLLNMRPFGGTRPEARSRVLMEKVLPTGTGELTDEEQRVAAFILDGNCAVLCDGCGECAKACPKGLIKDSNVENLGEPKPVITPAQ